MSDKGHHQILLAVAKAISSAIVFLMTLYIIFTAGPAIETRYFPPVSKLTIMSMTATPDGRTLITAKFTKYRACEYLGIAWYRRDPSGGFERVAVELKRAPYDQSDPNRPVGTQIAGPWVISIPIDEIVGNSFAELFHRCHPMWDTRTEFYP